MITDEKFETLCSYLADMEASVFYSIDFTMQCRALRVDPEGFDNMLYGVLGLSAEDVIGQYLESAARLAM